MLEVNV